MRTIENVVRAVLREAGIKLGTPSRSAFAGRVRELAGDDPTVMPLVEPLLSILATMLEQLAHLTKRVLDIARSDVPVCTSEAPKILHRMWRDGTACRVGKQPELAAA